MRRSLPRGLRHHWVRLALLLAVALAVRLAAAAWWQSRLEPDERFAFGDSDGYWVLGHYLADGGPYEYGSPHARAFRMPGYPLLLAGLFTLVGDDPPVLWARGLSALLGTAAVAAVYWLGREVFDARTGWWAAVAATLYPGAIASSVFVLAEAPFCPLLVMQVALSVRWFRGLDGHATATGGAAGRAGLGAALATGCCAALATLMRPSWALLLPAMVAMRALLGPRRRSVLTTGCLALAVAGLVLAPWWIRNYRVYGRFVPTTLQFGATLYDGLSPTADGSSDMQFVSDFMIREAEAIERERTEGREVEPLEVRLDRRLRDAALEWAMAHPGRVVQLAGAKLVRMWNVWPNAEEFRSLPLRFVVAASYAPVLILGLVGAWRYRRLGWAVLHCLMPAVYLAGLHMVFVSSIRYREPAMLAWMVPAAAALVGPRHGAASRA